MFNNQFKTMVQVLIIIAFSAVISFCQAVDTDCKPYGSVSIKGEPAADNVPVVAFIDGQEITRCLTRGGQYSLVIPMDDSDTPQKDGWAEDDNIVIHVNGIAANPSFVAQSGRIRVDLTVSAMGIRLDTWGKIKALFK